MKTSVIGKTDATLTLNKCGTYVRGKSETIVDVVNEDQKRELSALERIGLIVVINEEDLEPQIEAPKKQPTERESVNRAELETQRMGSKAFIATGDGVKEGRMTHSAIDKITQVAESEATRESMEAMKKIEEEEQEDDLVVNEDRLDISEKMGNKATVATGASIKEVGLVNSVLPESDDIKKLDPFIDKPKKDKPLIKKEEVVEISDDDLFGIGGGIDDKSAPDPFIEI